MSAPVTSSISIEPTTHGSLIPPIVKGVSGTTTKIGTPSVAATRVTGIAANRFVEVLGELKENVRGGDKFAVSRGCQSSSRSVTVHVFTVSIATLVVAALIPVVRVTISIVTN